jgi:hypothetical protein
MRTEAARSEFPVPVDAVLVTLHPLVTAPRLLRTPLQVVIEAPRLVIPLIAGELAQRAPARLHTAWT